MFLSGWIRGLAAAGALALCAAGAAAQPMRDVTIGYTPSLTGGAARIAQELGLYEKHGLKPKLVLLEGANASVTALLSRSADAVLAGPGELISAQARGQKVVLIANIYNGLNGTLILAKSVVDKLGVSPNAPVAERLKALDGLTIGSVSPTSSYTVTFKAATEDVGAKVRFTYMGQPAMPAALESGAIQAYVAGAPAWVPPTINGSGVAWISGPRGELPANRVPSNSGDVQMMRDVAEANPELARDLAAVFADLAQAFGDRPAEVKKAIRAIFPNLDAKTLDIFYESEALGFRARTITAQDIAHDIEFVKSSGTPLPQIDGMDPKTLLYP